MLILGHAGITLGTAAVLHAALGRARRGQGFSPEAPDRPSGKPKTSWFSSLAQYIDIRILLVGSLLPDIIDKPLGQLVFRGTFANGRIFCHTLLFLLIISLAGKYLYRRTRKNWLLALSFGTLMHLIFDRMWLSPGTLLWPLYGWSFPKLAPDLVLWIQGILAALITEPYVYVTESIGAVVLAVFLRQTVQLGALGSFIKRGAISS